MKIIDVLCVPGRSGFFTDDVTAIAAGALHDGFPYAAEPHTHGFSSEAGSAPPPSERVNSST
jgi:methylaspartate ammonia-lyase